MSEEFFGFGSWHAPVWFVGPEQGKGRNESESNAPRLAAWDLLGQKPLVDCKRFHETLGDWRWHKESPSLQNTWRPLMLLHAAYSNSATDQNSLRIHQRSYWGQVEPRQTALLDLSAVAARNLQVKTTRNQFLETRATALRSKVRQFKPELVVMFGDSRARREYWDTIAGEPFKAKVVLKSEGTTFTLTPHPTRFAWKDARWIELGRLLKKW